MVQALAISAMYLQIKITYGAFKLIQFGEQRTFRDIYTVYCLIRTWPCIGSLRNDYSTLTISDSWSSQYHNIGMKHLLKDDEMDK